MSILSILTGVAVLQWRRVLNGVDDQRRMILIRC